MAFLQKTKEERLGAKHVEIVFALAKGELTQISGENAYVNINDPENYATVEVTVSEGGSIFPSGEVDVLIQYRCRF